MVKWGLSVSVHMVCCSQFLVAMTSYTFTTLGLWGAVGNQWGGSCIRVRWGDDYCLSGDRWGIVDAIWVDGWCEKGLGVIMGGSDGEFQGLTHLRVHPFISLCLYKIRLRSLRSFLGRTQVSRRYFEWWSARMAGLRHWPRLRRRSLQRRKATCHVPQWVYLSSYGLCFRFEPHENFPQWR